MSVSTARPDWSQTLYSKVGSGPTTGVLVILDVKSEKQTLSEHINAGSLIIRVQKSTLALSWQPSAWSVELWWQRYTGVFVDILIRSGLVLLVSVPLIRFFYPCPQLWGWWEGAPPPREGLGSIQRVFLHLTSYNLGVFKAGGLKNQFGYQSSMTSEECSTNNSSLTHIKNKDRVFN